MTTDSVIDARHVYHGSSCSGLEVIVPVPSTHGEPLVYACKDAVMAALFLSGTGGDLTCAVGREQATALPYVCERFPGALEHRYAPSTGSLYTLPAETFIRDRTTWDEEVVSTVKVIPIAEQLVEDAMGHLQDLEERGLLRIYYHPSRPPEIPQDDEDLVMRGIVWGRERGDAVLKLFSRYHPHLLERIGQGLNEDRYPNGFHGHSP